MEERLKVVIQPTTDGEVPDLSDETMYQLMAANGWSVDDPGKGKAILDPYGREILNPMPVAPPIGYTPELSVMDRLHDMLSARFRQLQEDAQLDESEDDANDFEINDGEDLSSVYEIEMAPEVPRIPDPPAPVVPEGGAQPNGDGGS